MEDILKNLSTYGYIVLFLYSLGGGFIALLGAGVLSFSGEMNLSISILVAFTGNVLGDSLLFYMARYHKAEMKEHIRKYRRKIAFSHTLMKKHGSWLIVVKKFIYGLKTLIPLAIGLSKYNFWKFTTYNILGALIWSVSIGVFSYMSGKVLTDAYKIISSKPYLAPLALIIIGGSVWIFLHFATKRKPKL